MSLSARRPQLEWALGVILGGGGHLVGAALQAGERFVALGGRVGVLERVVAGQEEERRPEHGRLGAYGRQQAVDRSDAVGHDQRRVERDQSVRSPRYDEYH